MLPGKTGIGEIFGGRRRSHRIDEGLVPPGLKPFMMIHNFALQRWLEWRRCDGVADGGGHVVAGRNFQAVRECLVRPGR